MVAEGGTRMGGAARRVSATDPAGSGAEQAGEVRGDELVLDEEGVVPER